MSEREQKITRNSSPREFMKYLVDVCFTRDLYNAYITKNQPPCGQEFEHQTLVNLLTSEAITETLERKWEYENSLGVWPHRSTDTAIRETVENGMSFLISAIKILLDKNSGEEFEDVFPTLNSVCTREMLNKLTVLLCFFRQTLPNLDN